MMCSRCKKRPAVVFISRQEGNKTINEGICIRCAKELGIKPVSDMLEKMGLTEEMLESLTEEQMLGDMPDDDNFFTMGGASVLPFMDKMFSSNLDSDDSQKDKTQKKEKGKDQKDSKKQSSRKYLEHYCINLTQLATEGKIDNIVGRDEEIFRVIQILNRRTKNNPCLIGEPGVGKTAIAEGLAIKIAKAEVPAKLLGKEVYLLDLAALVAGTQFRGQFESRIKGLIDEVKKLGNIILVIDEVHNLVGAGDAEGSMNAANILKPALSRGEIRVIGATTFSEYRKYIEKDSALERRFQPVTVNEPNIADTVEILKGIKSYYEKHHNVTIDDSVLYQAAVLSERYITDRFLPDKAIDLLDEACSNLNLTDFDASSLDLAKRELEQVQAEQAQLVDDGSTEFYEKSAILRSEQCRLEQQIEKLEASKPKLTIEHLAKSIELWTGIPATKIKELEFERLSKLSARLKERIVGQNEAIDAVVAAIKRSRVGISPKHKPVTFIFIGPTGVGKTELVKTLAAELFDSVENLIRLDMSEFMEKHSVSRIIGAPPGYVGYDEAGQLTEKIRRKPYSVILFDEIEKAHPDVLNILLQVMDDGHITDAHGRKVNFENTIIIMTSNAGSDKKSGIAGFGSTLSAASKEKAIKALSGFLSPEFMNRVDEIIAFSPLSKENFARIFDIMISDLQKSMADKGIALHVDDTVRDYIVDKSFSLEYGARNLRRTIQKEIEDPISSIIVQNYDKHIKDFYLIMESGKLSITWK